MARRTRCKWPLCDDLVPSWDWENHRLLHENQLNLFEGDNTMDNGQTHSQYSHTNSKGITYYLNSKLVQLRGGKEQRIYYFSKDAGRAEMTDLPEGYKVNENDRNGFLTISRNK